jgi:hypothetical protein
MPGAIVPPLVTTVPAEPSQRDPVTAGYVIGCVGDAEDGGYSEFARDDRRMGQCPAGLRDDAGHNAEERRPGRVGEGAHHDLAATHCGEVRWAANDSRLGGDCSVGSWSAAHRVCPFRRTEVPGGRQYRGDRAGLQDPDRAVRDGPLDILRLSEHLGDPLSEFSQGGGRGIVEGPRHLPIGVDHCGDGSPPRIVQVDSRELGSDRTGNRPVWFDLIRIRGDCSGHDGQSQSPGCFDSSWFSGRSWGEQHPGHIRLDHRLNDHCHLRRARCQVPGSRQIVSHSLGVNGVSASCDRLADFVWSPHSDDTFVLPRSRSRRSVFVDC